MKLMIKDIIIDKSSDDKRRIRKRVGDISKLAESIKRHGLLHPIVVKKTTVPYKYELVAGERRLMSCLLAGMSDIEANFKADIDDIEAKEIELEENIIRENLSWMEECEALRQLNELKVKRYGRAVPGTSNDKGWRVEDTAEAVGMSKTSAIRDVKLAKDLISNPSLVSRVSKMPKTAARKVLKQEIEADMLRRQVARNELKIDSSLLHGDCCDLIDTLADNSIDCVITDPPFAKDIIEK